MKIDSTSSAPLDMHSSPAQRSRSAVRRLPSVVHYVLFALLPLVMFEAVYRWQLADTYAPELRAFNSSEDLADDGRRTVLIMGDSFTAGTRGYVSILKERVSGLRVINGGVAGTGVIQAEIIARRRFQAFHPSIFIYQVYVGNDLLDIRYPVNWTELSLLRNLYWAIANEMRSVGHLNYRLGQMMDSHRTRTRGMPQPSDPQTGLATVVADSFAIERYDPRVKLYFKAEPSLLENSIFVKASRRSDYDRLREGLKTLMAYCRPERCRAYVLVMPHAAQVDERYVSLMRDLGARFFDADRLRLPDYPFLSGIQATFGTWPNVQVLSPLPVLQQVSRRTTVYFSNDEHLNRAGNEAIAEFLRRVLLLSNDGW